MLISVPLIFLSILQVVIGEHARPEVTIPLGRLRGTIKESINGRNYFAFEGVPYAQPPIGKGRFKEPKPIKQWNGVWEANYLHKCLQYNHYISADLDRVEGEEDCLYLNIYTPQLNQSTLLDVIVFIHGGAFMFGAGHIYGERIIMDRNVVYVNLNYRLGPLGFLSTEDSVVPGNNGLKDQLLALKWIKKNIEYFGGNPDSITLTGMSAGGASVHYHYLLPLSKGLFHRGISQSGVALSNWALAEGSLEKAKRLAASVGCDTQSTKDMIDCLRYRPARQIVHNVKQFFPWLYNPYSPFGPVVEKGSKEPFLAEHPYILLKRGQVLDVPWITSNVASEGLYPASEYVSDPKYLPELESRWNELASAVLDYNYTVDLNLHADVAQQAKQKYLNGRPISRETFPQLVQMIGDRLFIANAEKAARLHAQAVSSPVRYYYFTYRGKYSKSEFLSKSVEDFGASHGDDCVYILSSNVDTQSTPSDKEMSKLLLDLWTTYASTGLPIVPKATWRSVPRQPNESFQFITIHSPTNVTENDEQQWGNRQFWDSLPFKEDAKLFPVKDEL